MHEEIIRSGEPGVGDLGTVQTTRLEEPTDLARSLAAGVILVARDSEEGTLLGEIHAHVPEPRAFSQVLSDLTIAVHPAAQGRGIGRQLLEGCLAIVAHQRPEIRRVELIARESNRRAIDLYRKLGFVAEGRLVDRIHSVGGGYEADVPMAWVRSRPEAP